MDEDGRIIYVENFPLNTTETKLRNLFKNFGKVHRIDLPTFGDEHPLNKGLPKPKAKGYAFIEFHNRDEAAKVCNFFNDLNVILKKDLDSLSESDLRARVLDNLEFKDLLPLRVMTKSKHSELTRRYNDQRFQSMVKAAKFLVIA